MKKLKNNQFERMKKGAVVTLCVLMLAGSLFSCGKKAEKEEQNEDGALLSNELYAKVENASQYSNIAVVELRCVTDLPEAVTEFASGGWEDGGFEIVFPETVNQLSHTATFDGMDFLTISNKNVSAQEFFFTGFDKDGNRVTEFFLAKETENGYVQAFFTFVDSDATISGSTEHLAYIREKDDNGQCFPYLWKTTMTFSVKWKKGWNIWYCTKSISREKRTIIEQWSTTSVSGLKWYGTEDFSTFANFFRDCWGDSDPIDPPSK